mgnify:CR=1 FL=1
MFNTKVIAFLGICLFTCALKAQTIQLFNSSFEGEPNDAITPIGWLGCEDGTTPDIMPGPWGVYLPAYQGQSYMGLIVRKNGTWECVGQRLTQSMRAGSCMFFKIKLAHALTYNGYNKSCILRVWGGSERCDKKQKLYESPVINHADWRSYTIRFKPKQDMDFLIFEAFFDKRNGVTYNGNLLLDDISVIQTCDKAELELTDK